jgi:tetratricopeptide (TPR) repeat protein
VRNRESEMKPEAPAVAPADGTPVWDQRFLQALQARDEGRLDVAAAEFRELRNAARDDRARGQCMGNEALCFAESGRTEEARALLREARRLVPPHPEDELRLELVEESLDETDHKFDEALDKLNRLVRRFKKLLRSPDLRDIYEHVQTRRGMLLVKLRRYQEARPLLEEALKFEGERGPEFYCELGTCYVYLKECERAKLALLRALEKKPEEGWAVTTHYCLGLAEICLGAHARAIEQLEKSEALAKEYGRPTDQIYHVLAIAWRRLGREDQAAHYDLLSNRSSRAPERRT